MELIAFNRDASLQSESVRLSHRLNSGRQDYIPPFRRDLIAAMSPDNSMYVGEGSDLRHFLVRRAGLAVGRVTAFANQKLHDSDGTPIGSVGMFDSTDDVDVAHKLLEAACEWLVKRHNLKRIWGPMLFDIWHGYRFMTKGFDEEPFLGEPRNRPSYPEYFERFGFAVKAEWDSLEVAGTDRIAQMISRGESRYRYLLDKGYRFEQLRRSDITHAQKLHQILCRSFAGFLGFTPITRRELSSLLQRALPAFDHRLSVLVYNDQNQLAGFAVALKELAPAVKAMNGRLGPWSRAKFLYHRRQCGAANFYIGGVTPEELTRRSGLGRAGFFYIINNALRLGYHTVSLTLRLKGNHAHGLAARSNLQPQREYALYEWNHG